MAWLGLIEFGLGCVGRVVLIGLGDCNWVVFIWTSGASPNSHTPTHPPTISSTNPQELLDRLRQICEAEGVGYTDDGLEAVIFSAEARLLLLL